MKDAVPPLHAELLRFSHRVARSHPSRRARLEAEGALRESVERYLTAMRASQAALYDWNVATDEVYFSPGWKQLLGYTEDEITNHNDEWSARLHPAERDQAWAQVKDHFAGLTPFYEAEFRLRGKDGSWRWILSRGRAIRDAGGSACRLVGTHLDITERKCAEEQLRASLNSYETALAQLYRHTRLNLTSLSLLLQDRPEKAWDLKAARTFRALHRRTAAMVEFLQGVTQERDRSGEIDLGRHMLLKIHTLGRFGIVAYDRPVLETGWREGRKPMLLLLALVTLGGRMVPKDILCDLFWPEADGDKALVNFYTTLHRLQALLGRLLGPGLEVLALKSGLLSLDPTACWADCWAFEEAVRRARQSQAAGQAEHTRNHLQDALRLYQGEYLPMFRDEPWIEAKRRSLQEQFAYARQAHAALSGGQPIR